MQFSDSVLLEGLKQKDEKAFEVFYETFFPKVFNYALALMGEEKKAEEVTEAVLVESIHSFGVPSRLTLNERLFQMTRRHISRCELQQRREGDDQHFFREMEGCVDFLRFEETLLQSVSLR
jgi:DNA-directed RNA polymerase specialized sigma24 family protein